MTRSFRLLILVAASLGCASSSGDSSDTTDANEHKPSTHAEHTAGQTTTAPGPDSSFAAMQARGATGMGVDQYTSTHTFEPRRDGGRITLRRDGEDSAGVEQIRAHLRMIAASFAAGDFGTPSFIHAGAVAGTDVMATRRLLIRYSVAPIARGGELIITTSDSVALDAIHRFLAFQRREHRAGDGDDIGRSIESPAAATYSDHRRRHSRQRLIG